MNSVLSTIYLAILLIIVGCNSYTVPLKSFKNQYSKVDSTQLKTVCIQGPFNSTANYLASPVKIIQTKDKKNLTYFFDITPSSEIRITLNNNKEVIFYADRIMLEDSTFTGVQSRFFNITKTLNFDYVKHIEIQNGKKKFSYCSTY